MDELQRRRMLWYMDVLRRYNEAIALHVILPFKVTTDEQGTLPDLPE